MSLYNMLHGMNPLADLFLSMVGLTRDSVGRFRDCYLAMDEADEEYKRPRIFVYTRNGGGNREEYQGIIDQMAESPHYVRDFDDDYDCTYATIVFNVPEAFDDLLSEMEKLIETKSPAEKWGELFEAMSVGDPEDERFQKAMEVGKEIFGKLQAQMKKGGGIVEV